MFPVQDLKGLGYEKGKPVGLVGVTELSDAQKKQLKEQQEVRPGAGEARSTVAGSGSSPHTVQWSQGQRNSFWAGSSPVNDMPTPRALPSLQLDPKLRLPHAGLSSPQAGVP